MMEFVFLGLTTGQWIDIGISFLIVVAVVVLGRGLSKIILERGFGFITRRTKTTLDDAILNAVRLPVYWFGILVAFNIGLDRLKFIPQTSSRWLDDMFFVLYFLVGVVFAWRFVVEFSNWYAREIAIRTQTDPFEQLFPFFRRIALIILTAIALITLLGHFNIDVSALVTTLGIGSLAIALAAQSALSDTISGFLIMLDRPFRIGDRIEILDLDTWGDVVDIGLRSCRIRTRDSRMVIVPNSQIAKSLVVNYSYPNDEYRLQVHLGVAYGTDLELARETMVEAVRNVEGVLPDRSVDALFLEFGDSSLLFRVRWWLDSFVDTRIMFDRVNTAIYNALNKEGIEMAYPQMDIHHKVDPADLEHISMSIRGVS